MHQYLTKFNDLARYAPEDVNTDEKKKDRFLHGMHQAIKTQLSVLQFTDFQAMVNTALISEKEHRTIYDSHKRKIEFGKDRPEEGHKKPRSWPPNSQAPAPPTTWTPPRKEGYPRNEFYHKRPLVDDCKRENSCFKCNKKGHYIADCPLIQSKDGSNINRNLNNPPAGAIKPPQVARVHHMSADETYEASDVTLGM